MTSVTYPDVVSPAEAIAASLCWLSRFKLNSIRAEPGGARIASKVENYWHDRTCRYCDTPAPELMARINRANAALDIEEDERSLRAFKQLPPKARAARVREAQEVPWYDEITRAG